MPWPGGPNPSSSSNWERCHFHNCEAKQGTRVVIETPDRGSVPRFICKEHREVLADAVKANLPIMVTPVEVSGTSTLGGTVWINTIADFWFGTRRPHA